MKDCTPSVRLFLLLLMSPFFIVGYVFNWVSSFRRVGSPPSASASESVSDSVIGGGSDSFKSYFPSFPIL